MHRGLTWQVAAVSTVIDTRRVRQISHRRRYASHRLEFKLANSDKYDDSPAESGRRTQIFRLQ
jgi:hypothetical protein